MLHTRRRARLRALRVRGAIAALMLAVAVSVSSSARAQEVSLSYPAPAPPPQTAPDPTQGDAVGDAVIAWRAGQHRLARELSAQALRESPHDERALLVSGAIRVELDPGMVLELDESTRRSSLDEFEAIAGQRVAGHILGIVAAVVGLAGVVTVAYIASAVDSACFSTTCSDTRNQVRFVGGAFGIAGLTLGGVAIGMHVDAGARWGRWGQGIHAIVTPTSLALLF